MIPEPIYILGPCSAESREQVLLTARQLKEACGDTRFIFRAGVWKARTSPHTYQGAGEEALEWLAEVKRTLGLDVATEVASAEHVEAALKAGIDYLWIGARTSANPIAVQEIADAIGVQNTDRFADRAQTDNVKGVLIKNPVNADAALWIGNIERLEKTGVQVMAVHRGCSHKPCWSLAHEVRKARPDIPMLLDPSHLSGDAKQVPELLKKVEVLGLDGAMIEVHCDPANALSDAKQQIKPSEIEDLRLKIEDLQDTELAWLRAEIDELDDRLWETIANRMDVSRHIGEWKKAHGVAPLQPERYQKISKKLSVKSEELHISHDFVKQIWDLIHEESLKQQK